ncbi:ATP-binding protein [Saccharothrix violaceirubra]|uniref:histidine kinase n=1 Tax=Saccharothrix violaceirubra TaxID=413306 RepID=A0A7W7T1K4_9PSEU|nr:nitrate- and nitrite sensing domain-containing protein [Saccharothrix violaceirubra]MBB4964854.1 signal transduction histidine kinase [Saccharothrix violaceirubra]
MKQKSTTETNYKTIRSRLTGVVVVPSIVLLVMWALFSSYTVFDGIYLRAVAAGVEDASIPALQTFAAIQKERELSMTTLSQPGAVVSDLIAQHQATDRAVEEMRKAFADVASQAPQEIVDKIGALNALLDQLPQKRDQLESNRVSKTDVYDYYNSVLDAGDALFSVQSRVVPDAESMTNAVTAADYFRAADWMSRATSLASGALAAGSFGTEEHVEFATLVGAYHSSFTTLEPYALPKAREHYRFMVEGDAWKRLVELENRLIGNGSRPISSVTLQEWQSVSGPISTELTALVEEQSTSAVSVTMARGESKFRTVLIGSLIALLAVIIGILIAIRTSNRLVNRALITRLTALKKDSLTLAHERLPDIVDRLREGKHVDVEVEVPPLDYGSDEIGQVADAFNAAQYTAVAAAVKESQAREGVNRVFLDIAHRNQGLVHRQLKILDKLEREEENPEQLDALFQLDHLATRARRNAENLIILAGEQPGRQWRKPVRLLDVLRAAVAETEQYVRVKVNPVPDTALVGAAVADTIHLIAELVDNATAFSSPRSQVQVHASEVPQGVVVEIEDHGLGINPEDREQHNAMLADPPEFDAMRLRGESRLGLFVVARLAARRGIHVELRESPYGGTLALVVVPSAIVAGPNAAVEPAETRELPRRTLPDDHPIPEQVDEPVQDARFPDTSRELEGFWAQAEAAANQRPAGVDPHPAPERVSGNVDLSAPPGLELSGELDLSSHSGDLALPQRKRPPAGEPPPATPGAAVDRPELPRRRRQQNLAPQLARNDFHPSPEPLAEVDPVKSAEKSRKGLSAFQRGTRDARGTSDDRER